MGHVSFSYFAHEGSRPGENGRDGHYALRDIIVKVAGRRQARDRRPHRLGQIHHGQAADAADRADRGPRHCSTGATSANCRSGALRKTIGVVPQEPTLFSDTIARNIAFGRADASLDEITPRRERGRPRVRYRGDAAWSCDTIVGERGMSLSGGQKQRVTIARLLTYDPAVVVLDDALSSVDTETERGVLQNLVESVQRPHHDRRAPIAPQPCATPTRSSCSTTARSPSAAPMRN